MSSRTRYFLVFVVLFSALVVSVSYNIYTFLQPSTIFGIVDHKSVGHGTDSAGEDTVWYTVSIWLVKEDKVNGLNAGETFAYIVDKEEFDSLEVGDVVEARPVKGLQAKIIEVVRKPLDRLIWQRTGGFIGLSEEMIILSDGSVSYVSSQFGEASLVIDEAGQLFTKIRALAEASYEANPSAADYFVYSLTMKSTSSSLTVQWVDEWASAQPLPNDLKEVQFHMLSIIEQAHQKTGAAQDACETVVEIARKFVEGSPTFQFDGIPETLNVSKCDVLESFPIQYVVTIYFDSRHAGYGDRTGMELAQVITPHEAVITVVNYNVVSAILDGQYDELRQQPIT